MNFETESRIKKNSVSPINIQLENFSIEFTLTEIAAGGALLYIKKIPIIQEMILIFTRLASRNLFLLKLYVLSHLISYLDVFTNTHLYRRIILQIILNYHFSESVMSKTQRKFFFLVILTQICCNMKHLNLPIILLAHFHPIFYLLSYCYQQEFPIHFTFDRYHFL